MTDRRSRWTGPGWVWIFGLLTITLGIGMLARWAVQSRRTAAQVVVPAGAERQRPARSAEAAERTAAIEEVERIGVAVPIDAVIPLGPADTGVLATFDGVVVGAAIEGGAWVATPGGSTIFVRSVDGGALPLRAGDPLAGRGIVRYDPVQVRGWLRWAGPGAAERSGIIPEYYLETTLDRLDL